MINKSRLEQKGCRLWPRPHRQPAGPAGPLCRLPGGVQPKGQSHRHHRPRGRRGQAFYRQPALCRPARGGGPHGGRGLRRRLPGWSPKFTGPISPSPSWSPPASGWSFCAGCAASWAFRGLSLQKSAPKRPPASSGARPLILPRPARWPRCPPSANIACPWCGWGAFHCHEGVPPLPKSWKPPAPPFKKLGGEYQATRAFQLPGGDAQPCGMQKRFRKLRPSIPATAEKLPSRPEMTGRKAKIGNCLSMENTGK